MNRLSSWNKDETVEIVIGGDVCPIGRNLPYFQGGDADTIFGDLLKDYQSADVTVVNLECPFFVDPNPILKSGPVLGVPNSSINGFVNAGIDILNLANNHILDQGEQGLKNTISICNEFGIITMGAGENVLTASNILIIKIKELRIAFLGIAENEFSIAKKNSWGACPLDLIDYVRNVSKEKNNFDYLIVLFHGGNENYPYPSPRLKKTCHFLVEMGADTVIVQHTHCPGGYEHYQSSHIVYGQGNLIFDSDDAERSFHEGFLVKLKIQRSDYNSMIEFIPYTQSLLKPGAQKKLGDDLDSFLDAMKKRSMNILDDEFVETQWMEFCEEHKDEYFRFLLGHNRFFQRICSKRILRDFFFSKHRLLTYVRNIILCESHRDVLETIFTRKML